jgi:hypothetical protein
MAGESNRVVAGREGVRRPTVIYVMGAGRSGSTVLGTALGNCESVFFAGELNEWLTRAGKPALEDEPRVRFWQSVRAEVSVSQELLGGKASSLERSSAVLRPSRWARRRRLRQRYRRAAEDLYAAVARVAAVDYVVDTSHYPLRARELQALAGIDLYLILLVRDPQGVVASLGREDVPERTFGVFTANAYLWLTNIFSLMVFWRQPPTRRLFVRHEEFVADPARVIGRILEQAGSSATPADSGLMHSGVPFHGNRLIRSPSISLSRQPPVAGRSRSPITRVLQLPWAAAFSCLRPSARAPSSTGRVGEAPSVGPPSQPASSDHPQPGPDSAVTRSTALDERDTACQS